MLSNKEKVSFRCTQNTSRLTSCNYHAPAWLKAFSFSCSTTEVFVESLWAPYFLHITRTARNASEVDYLLKAWCMHSESRKWELKPADVLGDSKMCILWQFQKKSKDVGEGTSNWGPNLMNYISSNKVNLEDYVKIIELQIHQVVGDYYCELRNQ